MMIYGLAKSKFRNVCTANIVQSNVGLDAIFTKGLTKANY
jgi:hypothetical protein